MPLFPVIGALLVALLLPATAPAAKRSPEVVPGQYIVLYRQSVASPTAETDARERSQRFQARHVYRRAVKGFAARLSDAQVRKLRGDPEIASVTPDRRVRATG